MGAAREVKARIGRNDDAEGVLNTSIMSLGVSELIDDSIIRMERVGPAMRYKKGTGFEPDPRSWMKWMSISSIRVVN